MSIIIKSGSSGTFADVDANKNLQTNLPTTNSQSGFARLTSQAGTSDYRDLQITDEGQAYTAQSNQLLDLNFNSASTTWAAKIGTNATTMTKAVNAGFMRLNNSAITTTTTGIAIYSTRAINLEEGGELRVRIYLKHANATATNKQAEVGLGYYAFAAGQAAQMNEFIGFRFTTGGGLLGVVGTSFGGAPTEQTININGGVPLSDNVTHEYELLITESDVIFFANGVYQGQIAKDPAARGLLKGISLPFIARIFHSGAASAAMTLDIGAVSVFRAGPNDNQTFPAIKAAMGSSSYYFQPDLTSASTATHNSPASGSAPTAATGSNTASVLNSTANLGGFFRMNGASIGATAHSIVWVSGYQNPAVPTAAGVANNARNFYCTGITVAPTIVSTVLVGGGFSALWFASIGSTALSSATTDADGTTAVAQKADRIVPLGRHISYAAAAAVGTLETGAGDTTIIFPTPLVVHPGEFLKIGLRSIWVNAAVTSGTIDGAVGVNGYWD